MIQLPVGAIDEVDIAMRELEQGVLPMTIRRRLPDATYQDVPVQWLLQEERALLQPSTGPARTTTRNR